jgi:Ca-activated chloride channel family protein
MTRMTKWHLRFFLVPFLHLLVVGSFTPAQQAASDSNGARTLSTSPTTPAAITLNLMALDKEGKPVTDLKPGDLHLYENKVEQKIESLSPAADEPLTIGFFFDISGSRRADSHIAEETQLVSALLRKIWHDGDTAFLVSFNDKMYVEVQPTQKLEEMDKGLKLIPGESRSSTSLYDALCSFRPEKLSDFPGRKIFIVLSDFDDNSSRNRLEDVIEVARQANLSIFSVVLDRSFGKPSAKQSEKRARKAAQTIAEETGGAALIPESGTQLPGVFQQLAVELQAGYRLSYIRSSTTPSGNARAGKTRIETTRPHVKLIYPKS